MIIYGDIQAQRHKSQDYGGCLSCGATWNLQDHLTTDCTESSGCFPLCQECWERYSKSTPKDLNELLND